MWLGWCSSTKTRLSPICWHYAAGTFPLPARINGDNKHDNVHVTFIRSWFCWRISTFLPGQTRYCLRGCPCAAEWPIALCHFLHSKMIGISVVVERGVVHWLTLTVDGDFFEWSQRHLWWIPPSYKDGEAVFGLDILALIVQFLENYLKATKQERIEQ